MQLILLLLSTTLLLLTAVAILACLRVRGMVAYLLGLYILCYSELVLALELTGLFSAIRPAVVLALQLLFSLSGAIIWLRAGRPQLLKPFREMNIRRLSLHSPFKAGPASIASNILLLLLALGVGYAYLLRARLIIGVPPDNIDSLTYHLSRVGYWLQHGSLYPWPTPNLRQTTFPPNGELGLLWTVLWWRTDQLTGFVQWITVPVIMLGIFGLVRLLGYSRWQGLMVSLLWATLVQVQLQASSTQNDLVTAAFWVAALFFLGIGLHDQSWTAASLSGVSLGLAIGTKGTSLIVLPGLAFAVGLLVLLWPQRVKYRKFFLRWLAAALLGFILLGSYIYLQNQIAYGGALGPLASSVGLVHLKEDVSIGGAVQTYAHRLRDNLGRYAYQSIDFSPLPFEWDARLNPGKAALFSALFRWLHVQVDDPATMGENGTFAIGYINPLTENGSWFGPLAIFLIAAVFGQVYHALRGRDALLFTLTLLAVSFLVVDSAAQNWTPYKGRYYQISVALAFPLLAGFLSVRNVWRAGLTAVLTLVGLMTLFSVTFDRGVVQQTIGRSIFDARSAPSWADEFQYHMIMENVPPGAALGLESNPNFRDYPLFGETFDRRVTLAIPEDVAIVPHVDTLPFVAAFQNSDYLFAANSGSPAISDLASNEFSLLSDDDAYSLWARKRLRSPDECDDGKWPFRTFFYSSTDSICPRFPIEPGLSGGSDFRNIQRRDGRFTPVVGAGRQSELQFELLIKVAAEYGFDIQVAAPKADGQHTLELLFSRQGAEPSVFSATFAGQRSLHFSVPLQPGTVAIRIRMSAGGDARIFKIQVANP